MRDDRCISSREGEKVAHTFFRRDGEKKAPFELFHERSCKVRRGKKKKKKEKRKKEKKKEVTIPIEQTQAMAITRSTRRPFVLLIEDPLWRGHILRALDMAGGKKKKRFHISYCIQRFLARQIKTSGSVLHRHVVIIE